VLCYDAAEVHRVFNPEIGTIVGGKYRLLRPLGEGGMGTVYEAENTITLKRAAVKWLHPEYAERKLGGRSLVHEARATSRIRHDNVVDVYDVVEEENAVFLVMELLLGEPLSRLLERPGLPIDELIALLLGAMRGVAAAHAVGVVHRDIKPDNIILAREPGYTTLVPKVIDFGISKMSRPDGSSSTHSGVTLGTPRYVSYEQLLGASDVDARTDVYAFGVIVYEALTGRSPYDEARTFAEQAIRFATQVPCLPRASCPEIPAALAVLVERAIAKDREHRLPSMETFILALEPFALPTSFGPRLFAKSRPSELPADDTRGPPSSPRRAPEQAGAHTPAAHDASMEPAATVVRGSYPASPRRVRVARVAVGLVVLTTIAALSRRDVGEPAGRQSQTVHPRDGGLLRAGGAAAPTTAEVARDEGSRRSLAAPETVRPATAPAVPTPTNDPRLVVRGRKARQRLTLRVDSDAADDASGSSDHGPQSDAGPPPRADRHRAGPLRRDQF